MSLEIARVSKSFAGLEIGSSVRVLENICYKIEDGKFSSIIGPSGCGKTTLLRIIAGLTKASTGAVLLNGKRISYGKDRIGLVFQEYALFPWRTTLQNIQTGLEIIGVKKQRVSNAFKK